ncbi:sugar-binding domain-containing protein [Hydrogenibacillus schlegelii]|uniref:Uncharacterized protein n=2 Tax=Hydrogenibacillus schlegelii TaxID=1484 RepID=A0A179IPK7_HYDSH|nr:sugar-binding domain-containing protein [Hydrogenibacillus schlegelii]MBT9281238.1 hypothetical protein [Hydrogenibacillus schlegelii]OAR03551.1 hypothetical protein SA87_02635 [Hydrogenibacillus schlegelii]PTQ54256.1 MAG: hypothetical protein HSCHL_0535 [Hydrogenibacillus schlegelii]
MSSDLEAALGLFERLLPELRPSLARRLSALEAIALFGPVGRRALAERLGLTERVLRAEIEALERQGLVVVGGRGVVASPDGLTLLEAFEPLVDAFSALRTLARTVERLLGLKRVVVVPGDVARQPDDLAAVARAAAIALERAMKEARVIAVAGGTTMAAVAEVFRPRRKHPEVTFVPARGGLGEHIDIQADTIAARLADRAGGRFVRLGVPDQLSPETIRAMLEEADVRRRLDEVRRAEVVFHGIGDAKTMSLRRRADAAIRAELERRGAVSEAFGAYYDGDGRLVAQMPTIGLSIEELRAKRCIAVAAGRPKAAAIISLAKTGLFQELITDQGAAEAIRNGLAPPPAD